MRYFIVTYVRRPDSKIDEQVQLSTSVKERDITTANIIIDFKDKKLVKSTVNGQKLNTTYDMMVEHYKEVYPDYITQLENDAQ